MSMKAVLTGEVDDLIGVNLRDNNDVEHVLDVRKSDGEITGHQQDGYPDKAAKRTPEESEHVRQARRYARWYVYDQRGYEPFPWDENIARIEAVGDAIEALSTEEFEEYFGEFHENVVGSVDTDGGGIAAMMSSIREGASAYYVDVFLDDDGQIESTSEVNPVIVRDGWERELESPQGDRVPDARIELPPTPLVSRELFQPLVVHQTNCQIRDYYIVMGEDPPDEYRVLGFGKYNFAAKYRDDRLDRYENYARLDVDIPGYTVGLGLEEHPELEAQVKRMLSSFAGQ